MKDVYALLGDQPGELARFGSTLGQAGVSLEGGGVFTVDGRAHAHFLVPDGDAARAALESAGVEVAWVRDVIVLRLRQDVPGQLGELCARMADAGVNIEVQYSDHDHRLVLVVDDVHAAAGIADAWDREWWPDGTT